MSYRYSRDEVAFLTSPAGSEALAACAALPLTTDSLLADVAAVRRIAPDHSAALVEQVRLRRRAAHHWNGPAAQQGRFQPERWLFTDEALQQASPPVVALHRARRLWQLAETLGLRGVHDVTCSIGTDVAALATVAPGTRDAIVLGSDIDEVRLVMARHNLGPSVHLAVADAVARSSTSLVPYADPARRDATGRRITSIDTVPPVADLLAAYPQAVLRLPPGIEYNTLPRPGEIELVSWRGSVREAVSWPAAAARVARRATVLGDTDAPLGGTTAAGISVQQYTSDDPEEDAVTPVGRYLIEPDPAVIRAHLVTHYAAAHGLTRLDPHLAYLTGERVPAGTRGFEVLDVAPYSVRTAAAWAKRDGAGTVEIKQRGTPLIPDQVRRSLRLRGDTTIARTLVIARIGRATTAFWCRGVRGEP